MLFTKCHPCLPNKHLFCVMQSNVFSVMLATALLAYNCHIVIVIKCRFNCFTNWQYTCSQHPVKRHCCIFMRCQDLDLWDLVTHFSMAVSVSKLLIYIQPHIYVTGMKLGTRKRQYGLGAAIVTGDFSSNAGRCADELWHFLCTHAQWFSHQKNRADDCDIIKWCHSDLSCYLGKEVYKEKQAQWRRLSSGFLVLNSWVYW